MYLQGKAAYEMDPVSAQQNLQVSEIWRYPIKSIGGEPLTAAQLDEDGITGDHMWALVDMITGTVASAKRSRRWGWLLQCSARLHEGADPDDAAALVITMPDGGEFTADDPAAMNRLSALADRPVRLQYVAAGRKTMEMEWAEETREGMEQAIAYSSARAEQDADSTAPIGAVPTGGGRERFYDVAPLHIITTSSARQLDDGVPVREALRKYRPNIVVGNDDWDDGYAEDAWLSEVVDIGAAQARPTTPVGRCVMVNLSHGSAPQDQLALRRIAARHRMDVGYGTAPVPALGIYADVARCGAVSIGDSVQPTSALTDRC